MPRATKAALASPNVVVLPTAAPRMVDNYRYRDQRKAVLAARDAEPWRGESKSPWVREREKEDRILAEGSERTPELLIALTILETMEPAQRAQVAQRVQSYAALLNDVSSAAAAIMVKPFAMVEG